MVAFVFKHFERILVFGYVVSICIRLEINQVIRITLISDLCNLR